MTETRFVEACAPATVSNLAAGFDLMAFAIDAPVGDKVSI